MNAQKKAELASWLVKSKGILNPEDQEKEIAKMAAQCPEAMAKEKGLVDDVDKAYETMQILTHAVTDPTKLQVPAATQPSQAVSAEEELRISKTLLQQSQDRAQVSANTSIDELILDRPDPKDIIPAGAKGAIVEKSWNNLMEKINSGTYTVMPDDGDDVDASKRIASTTNFNILKAAFEAGTPVDIYIGGLNTRNIGYVVRKGSAVGSSSEAVQMTREQLTNFVVVETAGYITASDNKPGVKLRYIKGKADAANPGKTTPGKTILADANKKAAIEAGSYVISREKTSEVASTGCKSALQFRVIVKDKFMKDGHTPMTRTLRVSLKADLPTLVRKPQFVDVFGTGERESNGDLREIPTGEQAKKISEAQRNAIIQLRMKANDPAMVGELAEISDKLSAFDAPKSQAPTVTM